MATKSQILSKLKSLGKILAVDRNHEDSDPPYTNLVILCNKNTKSTSSLFAKVAESFGFKEDPSRARIAIDGKVYIDENNAWDLTVNCYPQVDANHKETYTVVLASLLKIED